LAAITIRSIRNAPGGYTDLGDRQTCRQIPSNPIYVNYFM
jgi:hypothetical protein